MVVSLPKELLFSVLQLDLGAVPGKDGEELRGVGYVSNTHTQVIQCLRDNR